MWLKSHHWVDVPHTVYERRREMRVRESRHTVMLFDRRYYDIDTGKFKTDKLPTLYSESWADLMESGDSSQDHTDYLYRKKGYCDTWFTPKDNDFEEECRKEDEAKREREQREQREQQALKARKYIEDLEERNRKLAEKREFDAEVQRRVAIAKERERLDRELEESKERRLAYDRQLAEVEARIKAQQQVRARIAHEQQHGTSFCNVRPNKWFPK